MASLAFGPKGARIVTGSTDGRVRLYSAETGKPTRTFDEQKDFLHAVAWSAASGHIASGCDDGTHSIYDPVRGTLLKRWRVTAKRVAQRVIWSLDFHPDGRTLFSSMGDGVIRAWDPVMGTLRYQLAGHSKRVLEIRVGPRGALLASGDGDGKVGIWDLKTRKRRLLLGGHAKGVYAVAWHPNRPVLASADAAGSVRLWDTRHWMTYQRLDVTKEAIYGLAWSDDGLRLAVSSGGGGLAVFEPEPPADSGADAPPEPKAGSQSKQP